MQDYLYYALVLAPYERIQHICVALSEYQDSACKPKKSIHHGVSRSIKSVRSCSELPRATGNPNIRRRGNYVGL